MPIEIFWKICPSGDDDFDFGTVQRVRFRRPQLIKTEDIVSVFHERLERLRQIWWGRQIVIDEEGVLEQTEEEPAPILRDEKVLSIKKSSSFPLKITPTNLNIGESLFCVVHNIPFEERPIMGACTWLNLTQPLTGIELKINNDWWYWNWRHAKKDRNEARAIYRIANNLYWSFQGWINNGELVEQLPLIKGYNLKPQFDPSWTNCVMEDQCQECGEIHSSLPHKLSEVKVGKISRNYCHCRWKRDRRYSGGIKRTFKVIGAYPISPEEAEVASCEGMLQADSAD